MLTVGKLCRSFLYDPRTKNRPFCEFWPFQQNTESISYVFSTEHPDLGPVQTFKDKVLILKKMGTKEDLLCDRCTTNDGSNLLYSLQ